VVSTLAEIFCLLEFDDLLDSLTVYGLRMCRGCVAPSLAVLKIEFGRSTTKFFLALRDHPPPYLGSRLQFPAPPCIHLEFCTSFSLNHSPHHMGKDAFQWGPVWNSFLPGINFDFQLRVRSGLTVSCTYMALHEKD